MEFQMRLMIIDQVLLQSRRHSAYLLPGVLGRLQV